MFEIVHKGREDCSASRDRAKRLECAQLASAFDCSIAAGDYLHIRSLGVIPKRQQAARTPSASGGSATRRPWFMALLGCLIATLACSAAHPAPPNEPALANFVSSPLYFEPTEHPNDAQPGFVARGRNGVVRISSCEVSVTVCQTDAPQDRRRSETGKWLRPGGVHSQTVAWEFLNANPQARISGSGELPGKVSYFLGNDPAKWRAGVPTFAQACVTAIYPGVDIIYYGNQGRLEYDFVLNPGADPHAVSFCVNGADKLTVVENGDLVIEAGGHQFRQDKPLVYQWVDGTRKDIAASYQLDQQQTVHFRLEGWDSALPLVIDPVLSYSSYLGGSGDDIAWEVALDGNGNIYIAGETTSANLPVTPGAVQTTYHGGIPNGGGLSPVGGDAFVAKFDNGGVNLRYLTYLGGHNGLDAALDIKVDPDGNAYLTGVTDAPDFPTSHAIKPNVSGTAPNGFYPLDAFVTKLGPMGTNLLFSTYLGGDSDDEGLAIAIDTNRNVYVTGFADSLNFPVFPTNTLQTNLIGGDDLFVTKIAASGTNIIFSTYLGGLGNDQGNGIAVDSSGTIFLTGSTSFAVDLNTLIASNFPPVIGPPTLPARFPFLTNAAQHTLAGGLDAFLCIIDPSATNEYTIFIGGVLNDIGFRIALDSTEMNIYVAGSTSGSGFTATPGNLNPGGAFTTANAGATWSNASTGLADNVVTSLAIDPSAASRLYAGTPRGISLSTNGGASWFTTLPLPAIRVTALMVCPTNSAIVYAGTFSQVPLAAVAPLGTPITNVTVATLLQSTNAGLSWTLLASNGLNILSIYKLVADPRTPAILYAATDVWVYKSTNAGAFWFPAQPLGNQPVSDLVINPRLPTTLYAATANGVYRSDDAGTNWTAFNNGITNLLISTLAIDPNTPSTLYAGAFFGVYKSTDSGTNWTPINQGLAYTNAATNFALQTITALAIDPTTSSTLYAGATLGLFKSTDGGNSWNEADSGLSISNISTLAISPAASSRLYAGTRGIDSFGGTDAFLAKFGATPFSLVLGGLGVDQAWDLAIDSAGNAYLTGVTTSTNFPATNTVGFLSPTNNGLNDAFISAVNSDASAFLYSAYLGSPNDDFAYGIKVDPAANAYVVGQTFSILFPTLNAFQTNSAGSSDAFLAKVIADQSLKLDAARVGNNLRVRWPAFAPEFVLQSNTNLAFTNWTAIASAPPASNGWHTVTLPATNSRSYFRLKRQ